jgi:hypothetical protein
MERQARGVHSSRSVSTFASVALVPAHNDQPRRDAATVPTGGGSKGQVFGRAGVPLPFTGTVCEAAASGVVG